MRARPDQDRPSRTPPDRGDGRATTLFAGACRCAAAGRPRIARRPLVDPTPLHAWSRLWRSGNGHPGLNGLATADAEEAGRSP